ncbi:sensor histidine kinase [Microbacterium sp. NPDC008134]|uniref:sensor histidine kinase n=1 Tax=Microbacterium sp. NPDC008134 TaxID=3364183 RepID=UPI0036E3ED5A
MSPSANQPSAVDVSMALGCGLLTVGAFVAAPTLLGQEAAPTLNAAESTTTVGVLVSQALLLIIARLLPRTTLLGVAAAAMLLGLVVPSGLTNLADAAVIVAVLRTTSLLSARAQRGLLPLAGLAVAVGQVSDLLGAGGTEPVPAVIAGALQAVVVVALPAAGVLAVTARREAHRARTGESAAVAREHDARIEAAVARERTGMARELHDIAAHHVSGIAVMAAAIEKQIDTDPDAAKQSVRQVRVQSRALLDDLRRLVGLLRDADHVDAVETVGAVERLIADARAAGRPVTLRVEGRADGVGPLGQLVAFRMVQESLANAALHAPGAACAVVIDGARPGRLVVTVRNDPTPHAGSIRQEGLGLLGMRERAALVGGEVSAGREEDGAWLVRLELPSELTPAVEASATGESERDTVAP